MILVDDHIKNQKFFKKLQKESIWQKFPKYNWWNGWWNSNASNIIEEFIEYSWKKYDFVKTMAGFEYWSNDYADNRGLDWHNDKDEGIFQSTGNVITPDIGSVFWIRVDNVEGGYLDLDDPDGFQRVEPKENRFVIFNAGDPHRVTPVTKGFRRTLLINPWKVKPQTFKNSNHVTINCFPQELSKFL
jgi:hypothetical protein